jgi:hypothetical protein
VVHGDDIGESLDDIVHLEHDPGLDRLRGGLRRSGSLGTYQRVCLRRGRAGIGRAFRRAGGGLAGTRGRRGGPHPGLGSRPGLARRRGRPDRRRRLRRGRGTRSRARLACRSGRSRCDRGRIRSDDSVGVRVGRRVVSDRLSCVRDGGRGTRCRATAGRAARRPRLGRRRTGRRCSRVGTRGRARARRARSPRNRRRIGGWVLAGSRLPHRGSARGCWLLLRF